MVNAPSHQSLAGHRSRATSFVASTLLFMISVECARADGTGADASLDPGTRINMVLSLSQSTIAGGCQSLIGRLQLANPAPAGGRIVSISDTLASATTPATVTVPAGTTTISFPVRTTPVSTLESGTITAKFGTTLRTRNLSVRPIGVLSVAFPAKAVGTNSVAATATLECKAAPGPVTIDLASSNTAIANPVAANIVIPQGLRSAPFDVATSKVLSNQTVFISGTANGI